MKDILTFDNLIGSVTHVHDVTSAYAKGLSISFLQ